MERMTTSGLTGGIEEIRPEADGARAPRAEPGRVSTGTAVVLATAGADHGGPAAALPWNGGTIVGRLLGQLAGLGVRRALVITRPGWEASLDRELAGMAIEASVRPSPGLAEDLGAIADAARDSHEPLVLVQGEMVTHREALAGLLSDPRLVTGVLSKVAGGRNMLFETRSSRGRVLAASSPYHSAGNGNGVFLGALKVDVRDREALIDTADTLAALAEPPRPPAWEGELERKQQRWKVRLARAALRASGDASEGRIELDPDTVVLADEDARELERRMESAESDAAAMLLVGLVRSGVHVTNSHLRAFYWARPLHRAAAAEARREIEEYDERKLLLQTAVKANDGFFTTFFVSPYSKYVARWAARVGLTPNIVTTFSMALGIASAAAFATGSRTGLIAGAVVLQVAFTFDCVDGQLARYTRTFSKLGAWLDSVFDRAKEYVVFAGLALGSTRGFHDDVWMLAAAALALQTSRHMLDFAFGASQHRAMATAPHLPLEQPGETGAASTGGAPVLATAPPEAQEDFDEGAPAPSPSPLADAEAEPAAGGRGLKGLARGVVRLLRKLDRRPWTRWPRKVIGFPIGERFAVISLTAALFTPHTTFVVLLAWGGVAAIYAAIGRALRSLAR
jgi:phosphatidylglycerophosphate synthase